MTGPSIHQDNPKAAVEAVMQYRITAPVTLDEFRHDRPADYKHLREQVEAELKAAMPHLLSALLSDEVVEAAAKAEFESVESERWADLLEGEKEEWRKGQRASLKAAIEQVGGAE